jgi:hypothetical protein
VTNRPPAAEPPQRRAAAPAPPPPPAAPEPPRRLAPEAPRRAAKSAPKVAAEAARPVTFAPGPDDIKISFDRVAAQFPTAAFAFPLDQVGTRLAERGVLTVPRALVLSQLGEGAVEVEWDMVRDQFPDEVFAVPAAQIADRLERGRLTLPLDEIIQQLSPDSFATAAPAADTRALEAFPLPFQPPPAAAAPPAPAIAAPTIPGPPMAASAPAPPKVAATPAPAAPKVATPKVTSPTPPAPASKAAPAARPAPAAAAARMDTAPAAAATPAAAELLATAEKMTDVLRRFTGLKVSVDVVDGVRLFTAVGARVARDEVLGASTRVLAAIRGAALQRPVEQVTLVGSGGALVITPSGDMALATAIASTRRLALLEILTRRAAAFRTGRPPAATAATGDADRLADLSHLAPPEIAQLGELLTEFQPLTPSVFRDGAAGLTFYLLLPPDLLPAPIAGLAGDVCQVLARSAHGLGTLRSFTFRLGGQRLVVRPVESSRRSVVVVTAAPVANRPGLLHRRLEHAAVLLGAA